MKISLSQEQRQLAISTICEDIVNAVSGIDPMTVTVEDLNSVEALLSARDQLLYVRADEEFVPRPGVLEMLEYAEILA